MIPDVRALGSHTQVKAASIRIDPDLHALQDLYIFVSETGFSCCCFVRFVTAGVWTQTDFQP